MDSKKSLEKERDYKKQENKYKNKYQLIPTSNGFQIYLILQNFLLAKVYVTEEDGHKAARAYFEKNLAKHESNRKSGIEIMREAQQKMKQTLISLGHKAAEVETALEDSNGSFLKALEALSNPKMPPWLNAWDESKKSEIDNMVQNCLLQNSDAAKTIAKNFPELSEHDVENYLRWWKTTEVLGAFSPITPIVNPPPLPRFPPPPSNLVKKVKINDNFTIPKQYNEDELEEDKLDEVCDEAILQSCCDPEWIPPLNRKKFLSLLPRCAPGWPEALKFAKYLPEVDQRPANIKKSGKVVPGKPTKFISQFHYCSHVFYVGGTEEKSLAKKKSRLAKYIIKESMMVPENAAALGKPMQTVEEKERSLTKALTTKIKQEIMEKVGKIYCSICHQNCDKSRSYNTICRHSICKHCACQLFQRMGKKDSRGKYVRCPSCRKKLYIKNFFRFQVSFSEAQYE